MKASVSEAFAALRAHCDSALSQPLGAAFDADPQRFARMHARLDDLLFDYSKQRVFADTLQRLFALATAAGVEARRDAMLAGEIVNPTEKRAALHTALRRPAGEAVNVGGRDVS